MIRVSNSAERSVAPLPPNVIIVAANSTTTINGVSYSGTEVLPDRARIAGGTVAEVQSCFIQNTGVNLLYFLIDGYGCDGTVNYHGTLAAGLQLDCSNHLKRVWVFSPVGTTVATLQFVRNDFAQSIATSQYNS